MKAETHVWRPRHNWLPEHHCLLLLSPLFSSPSPPPPPLPPLPSLNRAPGSPIPLPCFTTIGLHPPSSCSLPHPRHQLLPSPTLSPYSLTHRHPSLSFLPHPPPPPPPPLPSLYLNRHRGTLPSSAAQFPPRTHAGDTSLAAAPLHPRCPGLS